MRQTPHSFLIHRWVACSLAAAFILTLTACVPSSPEAKVTATRAEYTVRLESFSAKLPDPPELVFELEEGEGAEAVAMAEEAAVAVAGESAEEGEAMAEEGEAMGEESMGEDGMAEDDGPAAAEVILHMLIQFKGTEALPGITVEVTQADPFGEEKAPTLHWIETAGMTKNDLQQVDLKLEGLEYEEGDGFSVLLRQSVPAEERGGYREYAEAGH